MKVRTYVVDYRGAILVHGGKVGAAALYLPEKGDHLYLYGGNLLDFRFLTDGYEDGLDCKTTGGGWIFTLRMNGQIAAPMFRWARIPLAQFERSPSFSHRKG